MFKRFIANLERPYSGPPSRASWVGFAVFFGIVLCMDLVQLLRGRGDVPDIAAIAGMLSMTLFFLSRGRLIRLALWACWMALVILYFVLRIQTWLR